MLRLVWAQLGLIALLSAFLTLNAAADPPAVSLPPPGVAVDPPAAPAPPPGTLVIGLMWTQQPTAGDFARLFPVRAMQENVGGRATLDCVVVDEGRLDCTVVSEDPPGYGFGSASLQISRAFRIAPETSDGTPTAGGRLRRTIRWVIA